jgi:hypothetical protein
MCSKSISFLKERHSHRMSIMLQPSAEPLIKNSEKQKPVRAASLLFEQSTSYMIISLPGKFNTKKVHFPAKKNSHILRPLKDDLGLKVSWGLQYSMQIWKNVYRADRSIH